MEITLSPSPKRGKRYCRSCSRPEYTTAPVSKRINRKGPAQQFLTLLACVDCENGSQPFDWCHWKDCGILPWLVLPTVWAIFKYLALRIIKVKVYDWKLGDHIELPQYRMKHRFVRTLVSGWSKFGIPCVPPAQKEKQKMVRGERREREIALKVTVDSDYHRCNDQAVAEGIVFLDTHSTTPHVLGCSPECQALWRGDIVCLGSWKWSSMKSRKFKSKYALWSLVQMKNIKNLFLLMDILTIQDHGTDGGP